MSFNEVKLIIGIEDPRLADRRERYGIEDESGCSAEEKIQVLQDVDEESAAGCRGVRVRFERVESGLDWIRIQRCRRNRLGRRGTRKLRWTRLELKDEQKPEENVG